MKTISLYAIRLIFFLVAITGASVVLAEPDIFAPERIGKFYWYAEGGLYNPDSNAQIRNQDGRFGLGVGAGYRYSPMLAWEMDILDGYQKMDTPSTILPAGYGTIFQGTVDPQASLSIVGLAASAKFVYPLGRFEPYAGGGIGIYDITLRATGQQIGISNDVTYSSHEYGVHMILGADYYLTNRMSLGIEFRKRKITTELESVVPGKLAVGGSFLSLMFRSAI